MIDTLVIVSAGLLVIGFVGFFITRDPDETVRWHHKILAVIGVSSLILIPFAGLSLLIGLFFWLMGTWSDKLVFSHFSALWVYGVIFLIGTFVLELAAKLVRGLLIFVFHYNPGGSLTNVCTLVTYTVLIYLLGSTIPGVHIQSWLAALSLSVIIHLVDWAYKGLKQWRGW